MKIYRFVAMAMLALLVVAGVGLMSTRTFAQSAPPPAVQAQATEAPAQPEATQAPAQPEATESTATGATEPTDVPGSEGTEAAHTEGVDDPAGDQAGQDEQEPLYSSSISVPETQDDNLSESDEAAALAGLAKITADEAAAAALAANPGTTVVKTELENENGALVYSVELDNGLDVKVDAGNAAILYTHPDGEL